MDQGMSLHLRSPNVGPTSLIQPTRHTYVAPQRQSCCSSALSRAAAQQPGHGQKHSQVRSSLEASTDPTTTTSPLWASGLCAQTLPWGSRTRLPPAWPRAGGSARPPKLERGNICPTLPLPPVAQKHLIYNWTAWQPPVILAFVQTE